MIDTRLLLLEGLPGSGKSTNSRFLTIQMERNGKQVLWSHEEMWPHTTLFFYEASLTHAQYAAFLEQHPQARDALEEVKVVRDRTVGIDLLSLKWDHLAEIGEDAYEELCVHDVWNFTLEQYVEVALEKWEFFVREALTTDQVYVLDSSIFQFQIYTFLHKDAPREDLKAFVRRLFEIVAPLNPVFLYLYRESAQQAIDFLYEQRGEQWLQSIYDRDKNVAFYQNRTGPGVKLFEEFLHEFWTVAKDMFNEVSVPKLGIDVTAGDWGRYQAQMLTFLGMGQKPDPEMPTASNWLGTYENRDIGVRLGIVEEGSLWYLVDDRGRNKRLIPKDDHTFYVNDLPLEIHLEKDDLVIGGVSIYYRWTVTGTRYRKVGAFA